MLTPNEILAQAGDLQDYMTALRRDVHAHPELGGDEHRTQERILRELAEMGIEAHPCADTGVVGILYGGKPGKTIGLRADIDALPIQEETGLPFSSENAGCMHACGHDTHLAALLGAAKLLSAHRDELCGNVKFFFQPDEEGNGGAQRMVDAGCLENPHVDAVFGAHNGVDQAVGQYGLKYGRCYAASNPFVITIHGKGCHGAFPGSGIDAVAVGCELVSVLQTLVSRRIQATDSAVVTVGSFHAGTAGNIIAETAELRGIIRTLGPELRKTMCELFDSTVRGVVEAMGATADVRIIESYPGVTNSDDMSALVYDAMVKLVGKDNAVIVPVPEMGTEDFGAFMHGIPGCYAYFGFGDGHRQCVWPAHSPHYRVDEGGLTYAAALHVQVVLDYLNGAN
ncbi:MAG: M20 family metallopeptidase [Clostridia bacterium]|nr:M20 family metallopeptidase [Clostridia bacterium]MDD7672616.1 M20 family metallopeptidase [Clostridia bacterium]MDY2930058.1 M20 family metallopeptidase [Clostridiaceae bacterium]